MTAREHAAAQSAAAERAPGARNRGAPRPAVTGARALGGFTVGHVDDPAERLADAMADRALGGGHASLPAPRRAPCACGDCAPCRQAAVLRRWGGAGSIGAPDRSAIASALAGPGRSLDPVVRARLEAGFAQDLSTVRVHTGPAAARASESLGADAFTLGGDIAFAEGAYRPGTAEGDRLIAHEVAHVVQGQGAVLRRQAAAQACPRGSPTDLNRRRGVALNPPIDLGDGFSVAYLIYEAFQAGDTANGFTDRALRQWVPWRFGRQSADQQAAVLAFLRHESAGSRFRTGDVSAASPGCNYAIGLDAQTLAQARRLSGEAAAAPPAAAPSTSPPEAAPSARSYTPEIAPAPGATPGRYTLPPLPATIAGPEIQPIGGTGTFVMNVDWASAGPDLLSQTAEAYLGATYQWEVWDVTGAPQVAAAERDVRQRMRLSAAPDARGRIATRGAGASRDLDRAAEDLARRPAEIAADQRAAITEGRYADAVADELNSRLLPLETFTRYGRELLGAAADLAGSDRDRRIDWPRAGVFVVRCIARVRREATHARAPSVATKVVTTRSAEAASAAALDLPGRQANESRDMAYVLASMGGDPAEIARLRAAAERSDRQAAGTPLQIVEGELADARVELAAAERADSALLGAGLHPPAVMRLRERVQSLEEQRALMVQRATELGVGGAVVSRLRAALVSRVTGETYQLLLQLAGRQVGDDWVCVISDVTTRDTSLYEGRAPIGGDLAAAQSSALDRALSALTERSGYGDGSLTVELPGGGWLDAIHRDRRRRTLAVRGSPRGVEGAKARLTEVATAMAVLGLVIGSGGVGLAGGLIAAGIAADNIARRWREGTLRPDAQLAGDLLDVLGAVAAGLRAVGSLSVFNRAGGGVVLRAARATGAGLSAVGGALDTLSDAGGIIIANAEMMGTLVATAEAERSGAMSPSEARRARLSAIAAGLQSNALTIAGRTLPGRAEGGGAPRPHASADAPSPRDGGPGPHPPAETPGRTMAGTTPGASGAPPTAGGRPAPPNRAAHDAWVDSVLDGGMGVRPPPLPQSGVAPLRIGEPRYGLWTMAEAIRVYDEFRARAPGREIGIYQHIDTGEYAVIAGKEGSVSAPREGRRERWADPQEWANVLHNHPNPENVLTYRNPAPADVEGTWRDAIAAGRPVTAFIDHDLPSGGRRLTALRVHPDGRVIIAYVGPDGAPVVQGYRNLKAYEADWGSRTRHAEPGTSGYRDLIGDVDEWLRLQRKEAGDLPSGGRTMAGSGSPSPAAAAPPQAASPAPLAPPAPGAAVVPRVVDPAGRLGNFTVSEFDTRTARAGGISDIQFRHDPEGRFAVRITGILRQGLWRRGGATPPGRRRAPNYNRSGKLVTNAEAGLPAGQWENLHLVGPGFGDEAAAGIMKGPTEVNQWHQNRGVEGWMRDLFRLVDPRGGQVRYEATAVAWDLNDGGWQPAMQTDFLRRAQYRVTVEMPNRPPRTITITIDVSRPPTGHAEISVDPAAAANPGYILDG